MKVIFMLKSDLNLCAHLFVCTSCTYTLSDGTESSPESAEVLRKSIKTKASLKYGKDRVRITGVKCLGECESGVATVLYPKAEWNLLITDKDEDLLLGKIDELCR